MKRKPMTWKQRTTMLALIAELSFIISFPIWNEPTITEKDTKHEIHSVIQNP